MGLKDLFSGDKTQSHDDDNNNSPLINTLEKYIAITPETSETLHEIVNLTRPQQIAFGTVITISFVAGWKLGRIPSPFQRFRSVRDIPTSYMDGSTWLRGRCVAVSDGDTFRFLHAPTIFHTSKLRNDEKMSENALPIRICTIDTPETAKFGKSGQPFGDTAKDYLKSLIENNICYIRLLQSDQYGRAVAEVKSKSWFLFWSKYADEYMLKAGLAEVYTGSGAVYGHKGKDHYMTIQENAKKSKKGIWSLEDRESASEYKSRIKAS